MADRTGQHPYGHEPVAVVGAGLVVPGADSPDGLWELIHAGIPVFSPPEGRWPLAGFHSRDPKAEDRSYADRFGFIAPSVADTETATEDTTRWLRFALRQALRDVRVDTAPGRCGFLVGYTADGSRRLVEEQALAGVEESVRHEEVRAAARRMFTHDGGDQMRSLPHLVGHDALRGLLPSDTDVLMIDTACSSALYAVDLGMRRLRSGRADVMVCGASFAVQWRDMVLFSKIGGLSRGGDVRALDRKADGVLFSDSAAVVVLKRLTDAQADGSPILGVLAGSGVSCDGAGKAINAPNPVGLRLALDRAWSDSGLDPRHADAVIAHATGTPLGDRTELTVLSEKFAGHDALPVISPKSVIGHTGWTAGLASLVLALSALRNGHLPAQPRFTDTPDDACGPALRIPTQPVPLNPQAGRARAIGVSASGFGGTNAHLVVTETPTPPAPTRPSLTPPSEPVVLVAWDTYLPGTPDRSSVSRWLTDTGPAPALSFDGDLAPPEFAEFRLPKQTAQAMDRSQLIAVRAARRLMRHIDNTPVPAERVAVIAGHAGPTRQAVHYSLRCSLGLLRTALPDSADAHAALDGYAGVVAGLVPAANEDAYPGLMPNLIAARVAHRMGWRGLNMTVDCGLSASGDALAVAADHVRSGDIDLGVVIGVAANATPVNQRLTAAALGISAPLAEGAFAFAVTRESYAREAGLPVLATLGAGHGDTPTGGTDAAATMVALGEAAAPDRCYLGAETAVAVLRLLHRPGAHRLVHRDAATDSVKSWTVRVPHLAQGLPVVGRHVTRWEPSHAEDAAPDGPLVAPSDCVVVTNLPAPVPGLDTRGPVLNVAPGARWGRVVDVIEPDTVREAIKAGGAGVARHVRVVLDLAHGDGFTHATAGLDLAFLAYQAIEEPNREGSFGVVLLNAYKHGVPRAETGLFAGFVRSIRVEQPSARCTVVIDDGDDAVAAVRRLTAQLALPGGEPVLSHRDGRFLAPRLVATEPVTPAGLDLSTIDVVLATGGGRGITAAALEEIARVSRPKIWIMGRSDVHRPLPLWATRDDLDENAARTAFVRDALAAGRGPVTRLIGEFSAILATRQTRATLNRLAALCGQDRVRYLRADTGDGAQVQRACAQLLAEDARVDLVLHGAGLERGTSLAAKPLSEFQQIRDVKVLGHRHLRQALGDRARLWCNFGSVIGQLGGSGVADYAAANAYLSSAATAANARGHSEWTVCWPPWTETGMAGPNNVARARVLDRWPNSWLTNAAGTERFLTELSSTSTDPEVTYIAPPDIAPPDTTLDQLTYDAVVAADDPFLSDHLVAGQPALAGMAVLDLAARAALRLAPGATIAGLENIKFHRFVRPPRGHDHVDLRIHVARAQQPPDTGTLRVTARITRDTITPRGVVLATDVAHCEADVLLTLPGAAGRARSPLDARRFDPSARTEPDTGTNKTTDDPYYHDTGGVRLRGPFRCTTALRTGSGTADATYTPADDGSAPTGPLPVPLLDATARIAVLAGVVDAQILVAIDRIDLHHPPVRHRRTDSVPLLLHGHRTATAGRFDAYATTRDGDPVVTLHGVQPALPPPARHG
ncbi:SDR family NAD(P)-dependent oxidoreductase [Streptomyces nigra]|uniref:SDR family NAD(P)-dependent oxidoreductase n=1 Tax=Streptomyces nigra TaxID=1827580 RepID=UPI0036515551